MMLPCPCADAAPATAGHRNFLWENPGTPGRRHRRQQGRNCHPDRGQWAGKSTTMMTIFGAPRARQGSDHILMATTLPTCRRI